MSKPYFEWRRKSPGELAQFVQTELPGAFQLPAYFNRLDLLTAEGARGVAEQLYKVVVKQAINYDLAPFDPRAGVIQQIRKSQTILDQNKGTCLDLAVLLAGMCLANDLLPLIVVVEGHAFLAVSLTNTRQDAEHAPGLGAFVDGVLTDLAVLQQWAEDEDQYLFVECTGAVRSASARDPSFPEGRGRGAKGAMSFERACEAGAEQVLKHAYAKDGSPAAGRREFFYALHIHDLQQRFGFAPVKDDEQPAGRPGAGRTHQLNISGNAQVGTAIAGDVHGPVTHTRQSGGINFGAGNTIGSIGDIVAGDKVQGDKIGGNKYVTEGPRVSGPLRSGRDVNIGTEQNIYHTGWPGEGADDTSASLDPAHLRTLIAEHTRRLEVLEVREARGGYNAPPEVTTEIERIRAEIARLHARLGE